MTNYDQKSKMNIPRFFRFSKYPTYFQQLCWKLVLPRKLKNQGVQLAQKVTFYGAPIVVIESGAKISIGERSVLCSSSKYTALGVNHPVILRTLSENSFISIGRDVGMSGTTICAMAGVTIGDECLIGANVNIVDTDFHPIASENRRYSSESGKVASSPILIGNNVFIGMNTLILKGVKIGNNSVIGAGSVVVNNIPADTIAVGSPAAPVKSVKSF